MPRSIGAGDGSADRAFELDCSRIEGIPLLYEQVAERKPGADFNLRQIVDEIVALFRMRTQPVVLRVLDLGNASPLACYLICCWAKLMDERSILLVASLDPEDERNASIKTLLDTVPDVVKELYLRPLTEYQIQRYLDSVFDGKVSHEELAGNLYRLSGGNSRERSS